MPSPDSKVNVIIKKEDNSFLQQISSEEDRDEIWRKISTCSNSTSENNAFDTPQNKKNKVENNSGDIGEVKKYD